MKSVVGERIAEYWRRKNTDRRGDEQAIKEKIEEGQMAVEDERKRRRRNKEVKARKKKKNMMIAIIIIIIIKMTVLLTSRFHCLVNKKS